MTVGMEVQAGDRKTKKQRREKYTMCHTAISAVESNETRQWVEDARGRGVALSQEVVVDGITEKVTVEQNARDMGS